MRKFVLTFLILPLVTFPREPPPAVKPPPPQVGWKIFIWQGTVEQWPGPPTPYFVWVTTYDDEQKICADLTAYFELPRERRIDPYALNLYCTQKDLIDCNRRILRDLRKEEVPTVEDLLFLWDLLEPGSNLKQVEDSP